MTNSLLQPSPFVRNFERQLGCNPRLVLDVGCHTGRNSLYLARLGNLVVGLDSDQNAISEANAMARQIVEPSASFLVARGQELPFQDGTFDVVLSTEVFRYVPKDDRELFIQQIKRVTKIGGIVALSSYYSGDNVFPGCESFLRKHELREVYEDPGWTINQYHEPATPEVSEVNGLHYVHSQATLIARKIR